MAIAFVNVSVVSAAAGSSACGLSAYMTRSERTDKTTGQQYDFQSRDRDLVATGLVLPDDAPADLRDGAALWNAATEAETVIDRKTGEVRFSGRAGKAPQVAKHFIIALPWDEEVTDAQRVEMAEGFVREQFSAAGVAAEYAVHRYGTAFKPADAATNAEVRDQIDLIDRLGLEKIRLKAGAEIPEHLRGPHVLIWEQADGSEQWQLYQPHAHVLVSTRRLEATGFRDERGRPTEKARELNPSFGKGGRVKEEDGWRHRWRDYQTAYFSANGLAVEVQEERAVPDRHRGKARSWGVAVDRENADRAAERQEVALDPDAMLDHLTSQQSVFSRRDVVNALRRHGVPRAEIEAAADAIIAHDRVIFLVDRETGAAAGLTTREVRAADEAAFADWMAAAERRFDLPAEALAVGLGGLEGEQADALRHALGGAGVAVIQGDPGTGKSYTMARIRRALEAGGVECWGLSNMNAVVRDMADPNGGGFANAETLTAFLGRVDRGKQMLARQQAWVIDEAAMGDNALMGRLAQAALRSNARLIVVGDDKQNGAVARGGLYTDIREALGEARLSEVRRQAEDWQRQATQDLAAGRIEAGLGAYDAHDKVQWGDTLADARAALVADAQAILAAGGDAYVLAATNAQVAEVGPALRAARGLPPGVTVRGKAGLMEVAVGERLQLYASRKREGLYNSTFGTVETIKATGQHTAVLKVRFDDGHRAIIDTNRFQAFGYGYAGTVYRDQGKSRNSAVLALYDSKFMWGRETTLVGLSRHKQDMRLYVPRDLAPDLKTLAKQMTRSRAKRSTLQWATPDQVQRPTFTPQQESQSGRRHADYPRVGEPDRAVGENRLSGVPGSRLAPAEQQPAGPAQLLPAHAPDRLEQRQAGGPGQMPGPGPGARGPAVDEPAPRLLADLWAAAAEAAQTPEEYLAARRVLEALVQQDEAQSLGDLWDMAANSATTGEEWTAISGAFRHLRAQQAAPVAPQKPAPTPVEPRKVPEVAPVPVRPVPPVQPIPAAVARAPVPPLSPSPEIPPQPATPQVPRELSRALEAHAAWEQARMAGDYIQAAIALEARGRAMQQYRAFYRPEAQALEAKWAEEEARRNPASAPEKPTGPRNWDEYQQWLEDGAEAIGSDAERAAFLDEAGRHKGRLEALDQRKPQAPAEQPRPAPLDREAFLRRKAALEAATMRLSLWRLATQDGLQEKAAVMARQILADTRKERQAEKGEKPLTAAIMQAGKVWDALQASADWKPSPNPKVAAMERFVEADREARRHSHSQDVATRVETRNERLGQWLDADPTLRRYVEAAAAFEGRKTVIEDGEHLKVAFFAADDLFLFPDRSGINRDALDRVLRPLYDAQQAEHAAQASDDRESYSQPSRNAEQEME